MGSTAASGPSGTGKREHRSAHWAEREVLGRSEDLALGRANTLPAKYSLSRLQNKFLILSKSEPAASPDHRHTSLLPLRPALRASAMTQPPLLKNEDSFQVPGGGAEGPSRPWGGGCKGAVFSRDLLRDVPSFSEPLKFPLHHPS